jgi:hypothetical protein
VAARRCEVILLRKRWSSSVFGMTRQTSIIEVLCLTSNTEQILEIIFRGIFVAFIVPVRR